MTGPNLSTHRRIELIAHRQSALSQEILDIPVAQGEPEVEPDSVPDDVWRKSVAGIGNGLHGLNCYHIRRPICSLTCQCPFAHFRNMLSP